MHHTGPMDETNELDPVLLAVGLGGPAERALAASSLTTLEDVAGLTEKELLALHGVGPRAVRLLRTALAEEGLSFRGDRP